VIGFALLCLTFDGQFIFMKTLFSFFLFSIFLGRVREARLTGTHTPNPGLAPATGSSRTDVGEVH